MQRPGRVYLPGISLHVIRRGINRAPIFGQETDYELILALLDFTSGRHGVDVHGYVMMTNHYHLMVTPRSATALPGMMRDLGREYVLRYNRKYGRIGTLWAGRHRQIPVTDERYWLTCLRYIEQNPVRAKMVACPGDYKWSSFHANSLGEPVHWLTPHPVYLALGSNPDERQLTYRAICGETLNDEELTRQRHGLLCGRDPGMPVK